MAEIDIARWQTAVLQPLFSEHPPPDKLPGGLALLSADTDRTQTFVFQSPRLPEIRGASTLLDELNQQKLRAVLQEKNLPTGLITDDPPGCIVYCGGGSLLALVPEVLANDLVKAIEQLYPQETGAATITAVYQPVTFAQVRGQAVTPAPPAASLSDSQQKRMQNQAAANTIQQIMRRQALALRLAKQAKKELPHFETIPYARLCQSCGRRPAVDIQTGIPDEPERYLCSVCAANNKKGINDKSAWNNRFEEWSGRHGQPLKIEKARDLAAIGQAANKYIGLIYADGNGIGRWLEETTSLAAYSRRSQKLAEATQTAVFTALKTHLVHTDGTADPFEIITIGGDDVILIVPANVALPVAHAICRQFGAGMAEAVSMSAGVVIAQEDNPIYFLTDLVHQLLKNAKKRTAQIKRQNGGSPAEAAIDFMVLKSQSTLATRLQDVRQSPYLMVETQQDNERCFLTGRPYTLPEIEKLLDHTRKIKSILAPGQLHRMRLEFRHGRLAGLFYYLYQRSRLERQPGVKKVLIQIEKAWGMTEDDDQKGAPPWRHLGQNAQDAFAEFDTPFLDMLTLREFMKEEAVHESSN